MDLFLRLSTALSALLVTGALGLGFFSPPRPGVADGLHMPLGLLALLSTLLVQAHFLSYLLTTGWELEHEMRRKGLSRDLLLATRSLKRRSYPLCVSTALVAVTTGILGMGARAMVVPVAVHRGAGLLLLGLAWLSAWVEPGVAAANEILREAVAATPAAVAAGESKEAAG